MCGICGILSLSQGSHIDRDTILSMNNTLTHRGPDDSGVYVGNDVGLGMRRLSVIDLSTGKQPIHNEDKTVWIVCNGEIYNYMILRKELEEKRHRFYTNSDTETIIHLYEEYGEKFIEKLNGMFAIALWDEKRKKLLLVRDRFGVKPLYYSKKSNKIFFASEIKALLQVSEISKELNLKALDYYLTFLSIPAPESIFKDIKKILPGHYLRVENGNVDVKRYWNKIPSITLTNGEKQNEHYYASKIRELLEDSVKLRMISDVPIGAFLSGGIDSSTIVGLMSRLSNTQVKTFSIGFEEEESNELPYTRKIAQYFNTEHHEFIVKPDIVQLLEKLVWYFDEPFAVSSALPTYLLSQRTREHVTVALTGDGADEVFAGYPRYWWDKTASIYGLIPLFFRKQIIWPIFNMLPSSTLSPSMNSMRRIKKYIKLGTLSSSRRYLEYLSFFNDDYKKELYSDELKTELEKTDPLDIFMPYLKEVSGNDIVTQRLYLDMKTSLPDEMLMKVDRMSMAASLEARTPFLDYRLVEFVMDIPSHHKLRGRNLKHILKRAVCDLLPDEIIHRKKHGFHVPLNKWLRNELKDYCDEVLGEKNLNKHGLFKADYVNALVKIHQQGKENLGHHLWSLIVFNLWHKKFLT